jgi:membrane associated rhomboid family serine protease
VITRFLIFVNVLCYLWEVSIAGSGAFNGGDSMELVLQRGALWPDAVLVNHQWWRIITAAFLHGSLLHIIVNMISLWSLGRFIEYITGSLRMATIYVLSMIASGLGVVFLSAHDIPTLGASGAIFGLFGALFAIGVKLGRPGMQLVRDNIGILILNLIITFTVPAISWQAHVSGLVTGFIVTLLIYYPPRRVAPAVVDAATGDTYETEYQAPQQHP